MGNSMFQRDKSTSTSPKKETKEKINHICAASQIEWPIKFTQFNIQKILASQLKINDSQIKGYCQVFANMYLHFRDQTKGYPLVGRRLFKYWCTGDAGRLADAILGKKNFKNEDERKEWESWQNTSPGKEQYLALKEYFTSTDHHHAVKMMNEFWQREANRQLRAPTFDTEEKKFYYQSNQLNNPDVRKNLKRKRQEPGYDQAYLQEENPTYQLQHAKHLSVNVWPSDAQTRFEGIADQLQKEISPLLLQEGPIHIVINLHFSDKSKHMICLGRFSDDNTHLELMDPNSGIFLIPSNIRPEKLHQFFKDYLSERYQGFTFNAVLVEHYQDTSLVKNKNQKRTIPVEEKPEAREPYSTLLSTYSFLTKQPETELKQTASITIDPNMSKFIEVIQPLLKTSSLSTAIRIVKLFEKEFKDDQLFNEEQYNKFVIYHESTI